MSQASSRVVFFDLVRTLGVERAAWHGPRMARFSAYPDMRADLESLAENARLGVLGRVIASVCIKLRIPVRGRLKTYRDHGPIGAAELAAEPLTAADVEKLMDAINEIRIAVWRQQPKEFFEEAIIEVDGVLAPTTGECKAGMDIAYNGVWGYHPLMVSLANTAEPLFLVNRPFQGFEDGRRHLRSPSIRQPFICFAHQFLRPIVPVHQPFCHIQQP